MGIVIRRKISKISVILSFVFLVLSAFVWREYSEFSKTFLPVLGIFSVLLGFASISKSSSTRKFRTLFFMMLVYIFFCWYFCFLDYSVSVLVWTICITMSVALYGICVFYLEEDYLRVFKDGNHLSCSELLITNIRKDRSPAPVVLRNEHKHILFENAQKIKWEECNSKDGNRYIRAIGMDDFVELIQDCQVDLSQEEWKKLYELISPSSFRVDSRSTMSYLKAQALLLDNRRK